VRICPDCLFASNNDDYFECRRLGNGRRVSLQESTRRELSEAYDHRRQIARNASGSLFGPGRTEHDALVAYDLAIDSARTLYDSSPTRFVIELARAGNYALKAADTAAELGEGRLAGDYMKKASELLQQAYCELPVGINFFRTVYQVTAVLLALGEARFAVQFHSRISGFRATSAGSLDERSASFLKRYAEKTADLVSNRDFLRKEGILPSYG